MPSAPSARATRIVNERVQERELLAIGLRSGHCDLLGS